VSAPVPGDPAPPLALPTLAGEPFDLRGLRGRPVLVVFLRHAG
jgi:peroxiredoxin